MQTIEVKLFIPFFRYQNVVRFVSVPCILFSLLFIGDCCRRFVNSWIRWEWANELNMLKNQVVGAVFRTMGKKTWKKEPSDKNFLQQETVITHGRIKWKEQQQQQQQYQNQNSNGTSGFFRSANYLSDTSETFMFTNCFSWKVNYTVCECVNARATSPSIPTFKCKIQCAEREIKSIHLAIGFATNAAPISHMHVAAPLFHILNT